MGSPRAREMLSINSEYNVYNVSVITCEYVGNKRESYQLEKSSNLIFYWQSCPESVRKRPQHGGLGSVTKHRPQPLMFSILLGTPSSAGFSGRKLKN